MDALAALLNRRSIRAYTAEPVPPEVFRQLLEVLMVSPSAADARPWQFVTIDRRDLLTRLDSAMPKCDMLKTAPAAILVCAEPAREKIPGFWPQDCAAATENLLIAIHALGYGGVWIGLHPVPDRERATRTVLGLPETVVPFALVAFGRPAEQPPRDDRHDPARIHANGW